MTQGEKTLAIVGSGAAGLAAAIAAACVAKHACASVQVRLFEKDDRIGRSILATGNGRCNFSNAQLQIHRYYHADFVAQVLTSNALKLYAQDGLDAVHAFFSNLGLVWREESDGRQFPLANKASVVLDVLRAELDKLGVSVECEREIVAIEPPGNHATRFTLRMGDGAIEHADAVIITCGGHNASPLEIANTPRVETHPVLGPLGVVSDGKWFTRELDNIRVRAGVSLWRASYEDKSAASHGGSSAPSELEMVCAEEGELLFRKYGVSGICVFDLSRFAQAGDMIRINFLQPLTTNPTKFLHERYERLARQAVSSLTFEDMLRGIVLPRVAEALLKQASIDPHELFDSSAIDPLTKILTCCELEVEGIGDSSICQVQRGGLDVSAFDMESLQIKNVPGLYAAGEVLDVDGPCGGYNLHWAWASGLVAGTSAAEYVGRLAKEES